MKFGKKPARPGAMKLRLRDYINISVLPAPNWNNFGYEYKVTEPWEMLGNDFYGDCVEAGAAHETMLLNAEAGKTVTFTRETVLSDYSAATGFNPNNPNTDQGTDMVSYASYRRKVGVIDASSVRHKVAAYLAITPGDLEEHLIAANLFGAVGIGFECPSNTIAQFDSGEPWFCVPGATTNGEGHYVPMVSRRKGMLRTVSWGRFQFMKDGFFETYNDESVVYLSTEFLSGGVSLNGFDLAHLQADLALLGPTSGPTKGERPTKADRRKG